MEEHEYQQTREKLNQCPCPFEKAILSSRSACEKCQRLNIAEREAVACVSPAAQERCVKLLKQLYQNARFALKQSRLEEPLPHAKVMKVQCGGLLGLQSVLASLIGDLVSEKSEAKMVETVENIDALVTQALENFAELEDLPYQEIIKFISHYQIRAKRSHNFQV